MLDHSECRITAFDGFILQGLCILFSVSSDNVYLPNKLLVGGKILKTILEYAEEYLIWWLVFFVVVVLPLPDPKMSIIVHPTN